MPLWLPPDLLRLGSLCRTAALLAAILWAAGAGNGTAQPSPGPDGARAPGDRPLRGVVWTPPAAAGEAARDLRAMDRAGVEAVRVTRPPRDSTLLALADTLGLVFFADLSAAPFSPARLRDSLAALGQRLDRLATRARRHPSLQYVGLARYADTTVPATCSLLQRLAGRLSGEAPSRLRTYYVTRFRPGADRCAETTDLVVADVRDRADPLQRLSAWEDDTPVAGILGTWTRPGAERGLAIRRSAERQARYLERHLGRLFGRRGSDLEAPPTAGPDSALSAVFAYRWRDRAATAATPTLSRRYGLHAASGQERPAARVVRGLYTGRQTVFAFPNGPAPLPRPSWLILLGWGVVGLVGAAVAARPSFRQMIGRYFTAHGFYCDAVRSAREAMPGVTVLLLALVAAALGITGAAAAQAAAGLPDLPFLVAALPDALQAVVVPWINAPGALGAWAAVTGAGLIGLWSLALGLAAHRWTPLSYGQALMVAVWPCWPVFPVMGTALVITTLAPAAAVPALAGLGAAGTLALAAVTVRVHRDFAVVARVSPWLSAALTLVSPIAVASLAALALGAGPAVPVDLMVHLLTRT